MKKFAIIDVAEGKHEPVGFYEDRQAAERELHRIYKRQMWDEDCDACVRGQVLVTINFNTEEFHRYVLTELQVLEMPEFSAK